MTNLTCNFDTIPTRAGRGTLKYDLRGDLFGRSDVIPMWVADMDFECAPQIKKAIVERADHNLYGYDIGASLCGGSVGNWLRRRNGWEVECEWLRFTTGVLAGLGFAIRAFTEAGDAVVIQTPVYPPFRTLVEANGRRGVTNPLHHTADGFAMDFGGLEKIFSAGARAIILCNPHNPVGRVFTRDELTRLGELCVEYDVTILSDEIHSDLIFAPHRHIHIASLDERFAARCVTFVAPSKSFNIAGLATSVAIISDEKMREKWDAEYARSHIIEGTLFGHVALRAAYDHCEGWLEELLAYLKGNVEYVHTFLCENIPSVKAPCQQGTYLVWLDFRELLDSLPPARLVGELVEPSAAASGGGGPTNSASSGHRRLMSWLADEAGLGLNSGADFGREGVGFARLNVATNRATLEQAMSQLYDAVGRLC